MSKINDIFERPFTERTPYNSRPLVIKHKLSLSQRSADRFYITVLSHVLCKGPIINPKLFNCYCSQPIDKYVTRFL